ncbi:FtsB family cell division protein [Granulicella arctica]|uniref:Cell division protein FtsB n=1 Tax=Granulicella arctica TaxID=940613 RepID=A0A7Y9PHD1_9BACT|nr:septum formation initiator family protein [Granulicella arctica]NYF79862.1 cell division protein FtsB [Granulicella arctica]
MRTCERIYLGRRRVATGAAAVLAVWLGYHVIFGYNGLTAYEQKRQTNVKLDMELGKLQRENDLLKAHVDRLQNDPSAIEHQAREELHYTRPGEVIYTLPSSPDAGKQSNSIQRPSPSNN